VKFRAKSRSEYPSTEFVTLSEADHGFIVICEVEGAAAVLAAACFFAFWAATMILL
jgi:hypothetical protein